MRAKLRARLPGLSEIVYVYENQESLVITYSPTEHGREGLFSLALYPDTVKLYFAQAPRLSKSDPSKLLQGSAKTVRYVEMKATADFDRAEIQALMASTLKLAKVSLDASAKGSVIIKAEAQKQRAQGDESRATCPDESDDEEPALIGTARSPREWSRRHLAVGQAAGTSITLASECGLGTFLLDALSA